MESPVSVSEKQTTIRTNSISFFVSATLQLMVVLIPLFQIFLSFIGRVTYPDHLIYGEFDDETVAKLVASPVGDKDRKAWKMHDGSIHTF